MLRFACLILPCLLLNYTVHFPAFILRHGVRLLCVGTPFTVLLRGHMGFPTTHSTVHILRYFCRHLLLRFSLTCHLHSYVDCPCLVVLQSYPSIRRPEQFFLPNLCTRSCGLSWAWTLTPQQPCWQPYQHTGGWAVAGHRPGRVGLKCCQLMRLALPYGRCGDLVFLHSGNMGWQWHTVTVPCNC